MNFEDKKYLCFFGLIYAVASILDRGTIFSTVSFDAESKCDIRIGNHVTESFYHSIKNVEGLL